MTNAFWRPAACVNLMLLAAALAGCESDAKPITAETSKFRPAGAEDSPTTGIGDEPPIASTGAADLDLRRSSPASEPSSAQGSTARAPSSAPSRAPAAGEGEITVPGQNILELTAYIDRLAQLEPKGATREEQLADLVRIQQARLEACKRILDLKPKGATKENAVQAMFEIYTVFGQLGVPGAREEMQKFATTLTADPDPEMAKLGRYILFNAAVARAAGNPNGDGKEISAQVRDLLDAEKGTVGIDTLQIASQAADLLIQAELNDEAVGAFEAIAAAAEASSNKDAVAAAGKFRDRARFVESDMYRLLQNLMAGEPDAEAKLLASVEKLLTQVKPSRETYSGLHQIAQILEVTGNTAAALECHELVAASFKDVEDKELADAVTRGVAGARKRLDIVGKPFVVEGLTLDGKPFDWSAYAGKVVLIDFWATWCGPCLEELPNIQRNYEDFHDLGFEVVGVNLDTEIEKVKQFFDIQALPWQTVTSQVVLSGTAGEDWSKLPMAEKYGVEAIPFIVIVGKDGNVDSLHVRGAKLRAKLTQLLGDPAGDKPAGEKPASEAPAEKPPAEVPASDPPATQAAPRPEETSIGPALRLLPLAALLVVVDEEPAKEEKPAAEDPAINPYAAKPGLNTEQLIAYIQKMLDKPKTIQGRPGFTEAVSDACDRVISADPPAKETEFLVAAESKFEALHKKACGGDAEADKRLMEFVAAMKADSRPRIARQVEFFERERRVLDAANGPPEKIAELLKELDEYYAKEKLEAKHLRMASSTVALINKLEDGDVREKHFAAFGGAFAKSSDRELARYGKKLAKTPGISESDLVGKPLELAGTTADGEDFSWESYRGKVVLVDFWATWCGPCLREMPHVKALREELGDKGFEVVGVSVDQDQEALAAFLKENDLPWTTLAGDGTQELAEKYGVRGIPTMMLVDKEGKVAAVSHNVASLAPLAEKLVGK